MTTTGRFMPLHCAVRRPASCIAVGVLLLTLAASPASGQDMTGTWLLRVDLGNGGSGQVTLALEQQGAPTVSGTYSGSYGTAVPLSGTAADGRVTLAFDSEQLGLITYEGTVVADTMWGTVTYGDSFDGTFEAFRRPPAGTLSTVLGYGVLALLVLGAIGAIVASTRA